MSNSSPEEDHDLAGDLVSPPGHGGGPGNLQGDTNQDHLEEYRFTNFRYNYEFKRQLFISQITYYSDSGV